MPENFEVLTRLTTLPLKPFIGATLFSGLVTSSIIIDPHRKHMSRDFQCPQSCDATKKDHPARSQSGICCLLHSALTPARGTGNTCRPLSTPHLGLRGQNSLLPYSVFSEGHDQPRACNPGSVPSCKDNTLLARTTPDNTLLLHSLFSEGHDLRACNRVGQNMV